MTTPPPSPLTEITETTLSPPNSPPLFSSRVRIVGKHMAEHKRNEVQTFGYDENIHQITPIEKEGDFLKLLGVQKLPSNASTADGMEFAFTGFVEAANVVAKHIKDKYFTDADLLVFKSTGSSIHRSHITDTECRPDYTAAFENHWKSNTTLWPCIRLVGEAASKGKTREYQEKQAISYLHYLLLARPDLHIAQGLLTTETDVTFLFGIGGLGIRSYTVPWEKVSFKLIHSFIYRLYDPGYFADPSFIKMEPNLESYLVTYTVQITANGQDIFCPGFYPVYGSSPFGTRTQVLSNPDSQVNINGEPLTVLKDQLCRVGTRFDEFTILRQIHHPEKVPGVVEAVYHDVIEVPHCDFRKKHRMGLRQMGIRLIAVPSLQQMLEIIFDILEVLRYLRFERSILHRDISTGNVLYFEDNPISPTGAMPDAQPGGANKAAQPKEMPLCFIKYLLGESNDPRKTSALLIDFNNAEDLRSKQGVENKRITRTGTPVFVARAVQLGRPVSPPRRSYIIPAIPEGPLPYASNHPERIKRFPVHVQVMNETSRDTMNRKWRHELDHDAESVFWLLLYWAVGAQPEGFKNEPINRGIWSCLIGEVENRNLLVEGRIDRATHSAYKPLRPLLESIAAILAVDRHWVESSDPRNDQVYLTEAFQRLVLQFILDNRGKEFMQYNVERSPRRPELTSENIGLRWTSHWTNHSENIRKRSPPSPSIPQGEVKRLRTSNAPIDDTISEIPSDGYEDEDRLADEVEIE